MRFFQLLQLRMRVDMGVMALEDNLTFPKAPEQERHY